MDSSVRAGLSPEWRPAWLISLANAPGAVFLHCTHRDSESPVEAPPAPSQSHCMPQNPFSPHPNTALSRMTTAPRWVCKEMGSKMQQGSSLKEEKEMSRKTWCCQL